MNKLIQQTVTITIVETWTITWADGAEQTVVYKAMLIVLRNGTAEQRSNTLLVQNKTTCLGITHARGQLKPGTTTNQEAI